MSRPIILSNTFHLSVGLQNINKHQSADGSLNTTVHFNGIIITWHWRSCHADTARHVGSIWHSRPCDVVAAAVGVIRFTWSRPGLVSLIPRRPHTVCPSRNSSFHRYCSFVRSSTGVGPRTDPVRAVYGGLVAVGRQISTLPTSVCWRHADIRLLPSISGIAAPGAGICVCRRGGIVDAE